MPPKRHKTTFSPPLQGQNSILFISIAHGLRSHPYDALWPSPAARYAGKGLGQTYEYRVLGPKNTILPQITPAGGGLPRPTIGSKSEFRVLCYLDMDRGRYHGQGSARRSPLAARATGMPKRPIYPCAYLNAIGRTPPDPPLIRQANPA